MLEVEMKKRIHALAKKNLEKVRAIRREPHPFLYLQLYF